MHPEPVQARVLRVAVVGQDLQLHVAELPPAVAVQHGKVLNSLARVVVGVATQKQRVRVQLLLEAVDGEVLGGGGDLAVRGLGAGDVLQGEAGGGHRLGQLDYQVAAGALEGPALTRMGTGLDSSARVVGRIPVLNVKQIMHSGTSDHNFFLSFLTFFPISCFKVTIGFLKVIISSVSVEYFEMSFKEL